MEWGRRVAHNGQPAVVEEEEERRKELKESKAELGSSSMVE